MSRHLLGPKKKLGLSASGVERLLSRHPPEPRSDLALGPAAPIIRNLASSEPADNEDDGDEVLPQPIHAFDAPEQRLQKWHMEIGARQGATVSVKVTELSGIAFKGLAAHDIVRALLAGVLVGPTPGLAEVLMTAELAERLLPGLGPIAGLRRAAGNTDLARAVHAETITRARRLDASVALETAGLGSMNPEGLLPVLMVVVDNLPKELVARWTPVLAGASAVGIAVVVLGDSPLAMGSVTTDESRAVVGATPEDVAVRLTGARLFAMRADEAVEVLKAAGKSERDGPALATPEGATAVTAMGLVKEEATMPTVVARPRASAPATPDGVARPLVIRVLGPYSVSAWDAPVNYGLRGRALALLAWYLLRPEGATAEAAVDALWPSAPAGQVRRQFWRALGDLRSRLRGSGGEPVDVLEKVGERYRPNPGEIRCDLWDFQAALADAARTVDQGAAAEALRRAVACYRGDLFEGSDYLWVEPARQDIHRRAIDAHLRLAELEERSQRPEEAIAVLARAVDVDRYAEEPYRRLMTAQSRQGRLDAVTATWQVLQSRLDELGAAMETATAHLYESLTADVIGTADARLPPEPYKSGRAVNRLGAAHAGNGRSERRK
jgi:DNA-binding SARP family transcriptional activator